MYCKYCKEYISSSLTKHVCRKRNNEVLSKSDDDFLIPYISSFGTDSFDHGHSSSSSDNDSFSGGHGGDFGGGGASGDWGGSSDFGGGSSD